MSILAMRPISTLRTNASTRMGGRTRGWQSAVDAHPFFALSSIRPPAGQCALRGDDMALFCSNCGKTHMTRKKYGTCKKPLHTNVICFKLTIGS